MGRRSMNNVRRTAQGSAFSTGRPGQTKGVEALVARTSRARSRPAQCMEQPHCWPSSGHRSTRLLPAAFADWRSNNSVARPRRRSAVQAPLLARRWTADVANPRTTLDGSSGTVDGDGLSVCRWGVVMGIWMALPRQVSSVRVCLRTTGVWCCCVFCCL